MTGNLSTKNEAASSKLDSRKAEAVAFWDAQVAPLLSELETTSSDDVAHLCQVCEVLWTILAQQSLLGSSSPIMLSLYHHTSTLPSQIPSPALVLISFTAFIYSFAVNALK